MDYGKFLYEAQKRERGARKSQTKVEIKEIRLRPKTGEHDINYKLRDARSIAGRAGKDQGVSERLLHRALDAGRPMGEERCP